MKASRTQEPGADGADTLQRSGAVQSLFGMPHGGVFGGMFATPKMPPAPTTVVAGSGAASRVCVCGCVVGLGLYGVSALGVRDVSVCARLRAGACESVRGCGWVRYCILYLFSLFHALSLALLSFLLSQHTYFLTFSLGVLISRRSHPISSFFLHVSLFIFPPYFPLSCFRVYGGI